MNSRVFSRVTTNEIPLLYKNSKLFAHIAYNLNSYIELLPTVRCD